MLKIVDKNVFEVITYQVICYLFAAFKNIILSSVHSIIFMKYVFAAKIWFMKTSARIVKYESQAVKSNPGKENF